MPDAGGNIKGIATTGKAGETIEKIFKRVPDDDPLVGFRACWKQGKIMERREELGRCRKPKDHEGDCAFF